MYIELVSWIYESTLEGGGRGDKLLEYVHRAGVVDRRVLWREGGQVIRVCT